VGLVCSFFFFEGGTDRTPLRNFKLCHILTSNFLRFVTFYITLVYFSKKCMNQWLFSRFEYFYYFNSKAQMGHIGFLNNDDF